MNEEEKAFMFKELDYDLLKFSSRKEGIGCPFSNLYKGDHHPLYMGLSQTGCDVRCGVLFPWFSDTVSCPCHSSELKESTAKEIFWAALDAYHFGPVEEAKGEQDVNR